MSKVRLWRLGNLEHRIAPTKESAEKLASILSQIDQKSDEVFDIIWDAAIDVTVVEGDSDEVVMLEEELAVEFLKARGYNVLTPVQVRIMADSAAPLKGVTNLPSILLSGDPGTEMATAVQKNADDIHGMQDDYVAAADEMNTFIEENNEPPTKSNRRSSKKS